MGAVTTGAGDGWTFPLGIAGRPIAATDAGGIPEVVVHGETGLIAPRGAAVELGAAIVRLLLDRALAARLGDAARRRVDDFSVARMVERTEGVYRSVLGA